MIDYLILPLISFCIAAGAMHRVHARTGSNMFAGLTGLFGFLFCLGMSGHFLYGCLLAAIIMACLLALPAVPGQS
jgi:hypothetical protein